MLQVLAAQIEQLEAAVAALERQLLAWHKTNPMSQRLASIPGIGPIIATAIATTVTDPNVFRSGREFAAWLGLVPRQNSTGGKTRLGGITKRGNRYLRRLLINGASANLLRSKANKADPWVIGLRRIDRLCHHGHCSLASSSASRGGLSRHSPGLVFVLAQHHRPGDTRRLVRQRDGDDQRRPPPTQSDHPRIGFGCF